MSGNTFARTAFAALAALSLLAAATPSSAINGREIMELERARDDGDNSVQDMQMILIDKNGNQRKREIRSYGKEMGEDDWSIMFFLSPADVRETGFLTYDYDAEEQDDDQWLYLPALKKVKRIASSDKSGSFMGSDFSYADMTERKLNKYEYKLLQEAEVPVVANGVEMKAKVWVVESVPVDKEEIKETGYTKSVVFIDQETHVVLRSKAWVKKGNRNKYLEVKKLDQIDGVWVATEMHMTTKKGKTTLHKTILLSENVRFGEDKGEDHFTTRQLEKGL